MQPLLMTRKEVRGHIQAMRQALQDRGNREAPLFLRLAAARAYPLMHARLTLELKYGARMRHTPYPRGW